MAPYNHAFLIVGGFPCWEEVKFVIFTVDHQVAPLTHQMLFSCAKKKACAKKA